MRKKKYIAPEIEVVKVKSDRLMIVGESQYNTGTGDNIDIVDDNKGGGDDNYDILAKPNHFFNDEEENCWNSFK